MEIYLNQGNDSIRFPVIPSSIPTKHSANIGTSNIIKFGEVAIFGGKKLKTFDLASFFPRQEYAFCSYKNFEDAYIFVNKLENWINSGAVLRLIVTGTNNNFECMISDFEHLEQDGTRDVYFTLSLIEYRRIEVPKYDISNNNNNSNNNNTTNRPSNNNPNTTQKTHKVVSGDTLSEIAQKYYGKGSLYPKIQEKNKKKYPTLAKSTKIIIGWVLDI